MAKAKYQSNDQQQICAPLYIVTACSSVHIDERRTRTGHVRGMFEFLRVSAMQDVDLVMNVMPNVVQLLCGAALTA